MSSEEKEIKILEAAVEQVKQQRNLDCALCVVKDEEIGKVEARLQRIRELIDDACFDCVDKDSCDSFYDDCLNNQLKEVLGGKSPKSNETEIVSPPPLAEYTTEANVLSVKKAEPLAMVLGKSATSETESTTAATEEESEVGSRELAPNKPEEEKEATDQ